MEITVNGQKRQLVDRQTVQQLMEEMQTPVQGTAVAVNGKVAKRADWEGFILKDGDEILVISAAYGG